MAGIRIDVLQDTARKEPAAHQRQGKGPEQEGTGVTWSHSPRPGVVLGHHLFDFARAGQILLPLHDRGHLQPVHRRLGDP